MMSNEPADYEGTGYGSDWEALQSRHHHAVWLAGCKKVPQDRIYSRLLSSFSTTDKEYHEDEPFPTNTDPFVESDGAS